MNERQFGARLTAEGASFRLWAPASKRVDLLLEKPRAMQRGEDGWFSADVPGVNAGARYKFRINDEIDVPDPASAFQPDDVSGPSEVIDHSSYPWRAAHWHGRPWHEAVVVEAHVGSFTREGTYRAMIGKLDHLVASGITALELMPLADFAGSRNWGYDSVLWYAPDSAYGRPDDLKALIDEAHLRGLMVFLDVVYNHFGPEGNYLGRYSPSFFTEAQTPWGSAIDYRVREVRAFAIENAAKSRSCTISASRSASLPPRAAATSISCSKTATTAQACWTPRRTRRAANTARSGTTIIITHGTCC